MRQSILFIKCLIRNNVILSFSSTIIRIYHLSLFKVNRLKNRHRITHKVEILCSNRTGNLKVPDLVRILLEAANHLAKRSGFGKVHHEILTGLSAMSVLVLCPVGNLDVAECEFVFSCRSFLLDVDGDVSLLAGSVSY